MIWLRVLYYSWKYRSWPTRHGGKYFWIVPPRDPKWVAKVRDLQCQAAEHMPRLRRGTLALWAFVDDDGKKHWMETQG